MEEKKVFPVFSVNACFDSWAMDQILVGAESEDDLIKNLKSLVHKDDAKKIKNERAWRIVKIPSLYTDCPYVILDRYAYFE